MSHPPLRSDVSSDALLRLEQHRMTLQNQRSSVLLGVLVGAVVLATLWNGSNQSGLVLWYAGLVTCSALATWGVRRLLGFPMEVSGNRRREQFLIGKAVAVSATWGSLAWVALDRTTPVAQSVLVLAVLAGVLANAVSNHAAMFRVFVLFCAVEVGIVAARLWYIRDAAFAALGWTAILYLGSLLGQARNGAKVTRAMMALRFENAELIQSAKAEARNALLAQQKAEEADLAKSKFLAAASHDLRQPVHAQGLLLAVLARSNLTTEQQRVLDHAASAARASAEMLDTLLDFSRIEAGVVQPNKRPFELQRLFNRVEFELGPQADAQGIVYRSRDTHLIAFSDPILIELVLRNLVSNAIRYTNEGGVLVAARARADEIWVEVWDTGVGIDPGQQQAIFREFHQLGNSERDRRKGLGLGLAIVQGLCLTLGHTVRVQSRPGRGSLFRLVLPLARIDVHDPPAPEMAPVDRDAPPSQRLQALDVLVIDDDESVRKAMLELLGAWGCRCEAADSQEEALACVRRRPPRLILCDYRLRGEETGAQVIAALRRELGTEVCAVLVTGDTAPQRLREAIASGIPLLHKPVSAAALHSQIVSVLALGSPEEGLAGQRPAAATR